MVCRPGRLAGSSAEIVAVNRPRASTVCCACEPVARFSGSRYSSVTTAPGSQPVPWTVTVWPLGPLLGSAVRVSGSPGGCGETLAAVDEPPAAGDGLGESVKTAGGGSGLADGGGEGTGDGGATGDAAGDGAMLTSVEGAPAVD